MLEAERHRMILRLLEERSIVGVGEFVELLSSSDATIRRDIAALAEEGKLRRVRGGAEAINPRLEAHLVGMPFAMSEEVAVPQKRAIARAASNLIDDHDSIIIAGGTTTICAGRIPCASATGYFDELVADRDAVGRDQPQ